MDVQGFVLGLCWAGSRGTLPARRGEVGVSVVQAASIVVCEGGLRGLWGSFMDRGEGVVGSSTCVWHYGVLGGGRAGLRLSLAGADVANNSSSSTHRLKGGWGGRAALFRAQIWHGTAPTSVHRHSRLDRSSSRRRLGHPSGVAAHQRVSGLYFDSIRLVAVGEGVSEAAGCRGPTPQKFSTEGGGEGRRRWW